MEMDLFTPKCEGWYKYAKSIEYISYHDCMAKTSFKNKRFRFLLRVSKHSRSNWYSSSSTWLLSTPMTLNKANSKLRTNIQTSRL